MAIFSTFREAFFLVTHPRLWFQKRLERSLLLADPFAQFKQWYDQERRLSLVEFPNAMCLSTVGENQYPDGRIVLLKEYSRDGFVFYTNTESRKGRSLDTIPKAALTFFWGASQRQVRIVGDVISIDSDQADRYFSTRPRVSQLGAWASQQSEPLASREELSTRVAEFDREYRGKEVSRPPHWSGYRIVPIRFEFWQLGLSRLHDRFQYTLKEDDGGWEIVRLNP